MGVGSLRETETETDLSSESGRPGALNRSALPELDAAALLGPPASALSLRTGFVPPNARFFDHMRAKPKAPAGRGFRRGSNRVRCFASAKCETFFCFDVPARTVPVGARPTQCRLHACRALCVNGASRCTSTRSLPSTSDTTLPPSRLLHTCT